MSSVKRTKSIALLFKNGSNLQTTTTHDQFLISSGLNTNTKHLNSQFKSTLAMNSFSTSKLSSLTVNVPKHTTSSIAKTNLILVIPHTVVNNTVFTSTGSFHHNVSKVPKTPITNRHCKRNLTTKSFGKSNISSLTVRIIRTQGTRSRIAKTIGLIFSATFATASVATISPSANRPKRSCAIAILTHQADTLISNIAHVQNAIRIHTSSNDRYAISPSPNANVNDYALATNTPNILALATRCPKTVNFQPDTTAPHTCAIDTPIRAVFRGNFRTP